jgi:hypothetical protein
LGFAVALIRAIAARVGSRFDLGFAPRSWVLELSGVGYAVVRFSGLWVVERRAEKGAEDNFQYTCLPTLLPLSLDTDRHGTARGVFGKAG